MSMEVKLKGGWIAFFVIVIIVAFLGLIIYSVDISVRECKNDLECSNGYCGSDFKCHELTQNKIGKPSSIDYNFYVALGLIALLVVAFNLFYKVKK